MSIWGLFSLYGNNFLMRYPDSFGQRRNKTPARVIRILRESYHKTGIRWMKSEATQGPNLILLKCQHIDLEVLMFNLNRPDISTTLSQHCNNIATLSQHCYNVVTTLLQCCHNIATTLSQHFYNVVTTLLQRCHIITMLLQHCHNVLTNC